MVCVILESSTDSLILHSTDGRPLMLHNIIAHIFMAGTRYAGDKFTEREVKLKPLKLAQKKREESLKPLRRDADDAIRVMKAHLSAVYKLEEELELREIELRLYPDSLEKQGTADQARSNLATARERSSEAVALAEELSRKLREKVRVGEQEDAEMKSRLLS